MIYKSTVHGGIVTFAEAGQHSTLGRAGTFCLPKSGIVSDELHFFSELQLVVHEV